MTYTYYKSELRLTITTTAFFAKVISANIVFLLAIVAYTSIIFSYFIVAKGADSVIVGNTLQRIPKRQRHV
jgi:hypothetical protein